MPPFGARQFEELIDVADRLIVDSTEWPGLPTPYARARRDLRRVAVSDIAWARTSRWRPQLASLWPGIATFEAIRVTGTEAQAHLLAGWLRSRLAATSSSSTSPPTSSWGSSSTASRRRSRPAIRPTPADLLSDELDRFGRDPVYEAAVRATVV